MSEEMIEAKIYFDNYQGVFINIKILEREIIELLQTLREGYSIVYKTHGTFGDAKSDWVRVQMTRR